jgi:hypothetical protein
MQFSARVSRQRLAQFLFVGVLLTCSGVAQADCSPTPYLVGVGFTDLNKNPVSTVNPNTNYFIKVCSRAPSVCVRLTSGAQHVGRLDPLNACNDVVFPSPYTPGDIGTTYFTVQPSGPGVPLIGRVTPWDACTGEKPDAGLNFSLPGSQCEGTSRSYVCGFAKAGQNCNNWRVSKSTPQSSMAAAIPACRAAPVPGYTDFCYTRNSSVAAPADATECAAAGGSWRPKNACCNFKGTLSCPW